MHEASAVAALVTMLVPEAEKRGATRISAMHLVVGETTGYMKDSFEFYLERLAKGTLLEGAEVDIRYVKALLECRSCGGSFERRRFSFECPACGGQGRLTGTGSEFYVDSIELEGVAP